jgi:hypothetical protein
MTVLPLLVLAAAANPARPAPAMVAQYVVTTLVRGGGHLASEF